MLSGNQHGALTRPLSFSLFKISTTSFLSPPFSSTPNNHRNSTFSNHVSQISNGIAHNMPTVYSQLLQFRYLHSEQSPSFLDNHVNSICSLLSNQIHQSTTIDDLLEHHKDKLSSTLVEQVLLNYKDIGRARTLEFFSWAGFRLGFKFDDSVVEYVADFLGRRKLFDDLKCLLLTVSAYNGKISCRAISTCIRFLGRQGRVKEALCLFKEMESEFKCKPDNLVFNNMLYVLCKKEASEDLIDVAFDIFRKIESPDTYSYSNILVGLCKFGRYEVAINVFREMSRHKLVPTRSSLNIFMGHLCNLSSKEGAIEKVKVNNSRRSFTILVPNVSSRHGAIKPAIGVFWAVQNIGLLPSTFVINQLISELSRLGKLDEAIQILAALETRKSACVPEMYSIVLQGLCEHRLVHEACKLFEKIMAKGLNPKIIVYNSMISVCCKIGNLEYSEKIFKMMKKNRRDPDTITYTWLIHGYGEARNWEVAYELLMEMLGLGWCPHFHTYNLVNKLLKEHDRDDLCVKLERKMETQSLSKLCKMGRLEDAYLKMESMLEKGIFPPIYLRELFQKTFQKNGKGNIALVLLKKMDESHKTEEARV